MAWLIKGRGAEMNEMCDWCGPAVAAVYRVERHGELYLCGHCTNRLWAALFAQGWTIGPASEHALAPQADECSGTSSQRTRRERGSGRSPRILRWRFRRLRALALVITAHGPQRLTRGSVMTTARQRSRSMPEESPTPEQQLALTVPGARA